MSSVQEKKNNSATITGITSALGTLAGRGAKLPIGTTATLIAGGATEGGEGALRAGVGHTLGGHIGKRLGELAGVGAGALIGHRVPLTAMRAGSIVGEAGGAGLGTYLMMKGKEKIASSPLPGWGAFPSDVPTILKPFNSQAGLTVAGAREAVQGELDKLKDATGNLHHFVPRTLKDGIKKHLIEVQKDMYQSVGVPAEGGVLNPGKALNYLESIPNNKKLRELSSVSRKLNPEQRLAVGKIIDLHEADEWRTAKALGSTASRATHSHVDPSIILKEHNRLALGDEGVTNYFKKMRSGGTGEAKVLRDIVDVATKGSEMFDYGSSKPVSQEVMDKVRKNVSGIDIRDINKIRDIKTNALVRTLGLGAAGLGMAGIGYGLHQALKNKE